jgi:gamma-glutamyltranspeptidase / glutathione hydrolase
MPLLQLVRTIIGHLWALLPEYKADLINDLAAVLNLTEPASTGIGGDMFVLYYEASTKKVRALNGSGRSGKKPSLETVRKELGIKDGESGVIPMDSVHSVTVPGAAAGWVDTVDKLGSGNLSMEQVLAPAIELAEDGFPVHELSATFVSSSLLEASHQLTLAVTVEKW